MALPPLTVPLYPNVPLTAGVPPVLRSALFPTPELGDPLTRDGPGVQENRAPPTWGIFSADGAQLVFPDTATGVDFTKDAAVSTFPIEGGLFASYDKVQQPAQVRMTMVKGGSVEDQAAFLDTFAELQQSLELITAVTPTAIYPELNVSRYDYSRRREDGAYITTVNVLLAQIRVATAAAYSQTQEPNGADAVNTGAQRPQEPTATQAAAFGPEV